MSGRYRANGPLRGLIRRARDRLGGAGQCRDVAIACQGGGSHAAFTAGVLGRLLAELPDGYRLRGVSGTSGGALCAAAGLYGLLDPDGDPETVLESLWLDVAATSAWEQWVNDVTVSKVERGATAGGAPSPYANPGADWGKRRLATIVEENVDVAALVDHLRAAGAPSLLVAAAAAASGEHVTFRDDAVTLESLLASSAIPELFEAVDIDGVEYWDGLFARNPPIREFVAPDDPGPVDDLWLIQLTPRRVTDVPRRGDRIQERIRHLVCNLSLEQELSHVETVNEWREAGHLEGSPTRVRRITLHDERAESSKLDRDEAFVRDLLADGRAEAVGFLSELSNGD